jgi:hypothetical protein
MRRPPATKTSRRLPLPGRLPYDPFASKRLSYVAWSSPPALRMFGRRDRTTPLAKQHSGGLKKFSARGESQRLRRMSPLPPIASQFPRQSAIAISMVRSACERHLRPARIRRTVETSRSNSIGFVSYSLQPAASAFSRRQVPCRGCLCSDNKSVCPGGGFGSKPVDAS